MKQRQIAILSAMAVLALAGCGDSANEQPVAMSYDEYFTSFAFDFEPAADRAGLADRSEAVVSATLVDVVDGPVYGSSATDPAGSRFAVFMFEAATGEQLAVRLPRPNMSDLAALRDAMPIGDRAVLYLVPVPKIPDSEKGLWFGIDENVQQWEPTTPQGFILERHADGGSYVVDVPIDGGDEIGDAPAPGSDISAWLPPQGEIQPTRG